MYLDDPNRRIKITEELRSFFVDERKRRNYTATAIANKMDRPQSWIAQIENGRTQSIKQQDLVLLFSVILDTSMQEADEYLTKQLVTLQYRKNSEDKLQLNENEIRFYKDEEADFLDLAKSRQAFETIKENIMSYFDVIFDNMTDKREPLELMSSITQNMFLDLGFIINLYALPWCSLKNLPIEKKKQIMKEVFEIIKSNHNCENCSFKNDGKNCNAME